MDHRERFFINRLDLPIYKKYKELHTSSEIKALYFNNSGTEQLNYGFSNLTTLQKLGDSYYFLVSLTTLKEKTKNANGFFINMHPLVIGFFTSLIGTLDSLAQEVNILFCGGTITDRTYFSSIVTKLKEMRPQVNKIKAKFKIIKESKEYKEIKNYRNTLVHRRIVFIGWDPISSNLSLVKVEPDLSFEEAIKKVHPGTEQLQDNDFYYPHLTISEQCGLYFNTVKKSIKEFWEMFFEILKHAS